MRSWLWSTAILFCACNGEVSSGGPLDGPHGGRIDLSGQPPMGDGLFQSGGDGTAVLNACGDFDPGCTQSSFGPPMASFPLQSDPMPRAGETDSGVGRDPNGYLVLSSTSSNFDFLWVANTDDWGVGSISKLDTHKIKEVARYFTVTCFSNPTGSRAACDGTNGCCTRDDYTDYNYRLNNAGKSSGKHEAVNQKSNVPSRTAVDFNGDVWVANRAFGLQSSASKIANDVSECVERNGTPGIQTSTDANGDGVIDTDCNGNNVPDDINDVKGAPCLAGHPQEFFGFDDECILLTTNTNQPDQWGRPLALGRGDVDNGPSDAWAGTFKDGKFFRIDGKTGMTKAQGTVPGITPYGASIDMAGILWAVNLQGGIAYFDTANPTTSGKGRTPTFPLGGYGITLDRDQNIWMGGYGNGNAYRYTPDRTQGTTRLAQGFWTVVTDVGAANGATGAGRGIAADSRTMTSYWVWMARDAGGYVVRIPGSTIPAPAGQDVMIDGRSMAAIKVAGNNTIGAGVDTDQNIWGISYSGSVATRIKVDAAGNTTAPDVMSGANNMGCPVGAGDRCTLNLAGRNTSADPYTYSDFTGFGLRNFTNPKGSWSWIQPGCNQEETHWLKIVWSADVPPNTTLTVRARSGMTPKPDNTWGQWTGSYTMSPADLKVAPGPLMPTPAAFMQIEVDLQSMDRAATPKLKSLNILYECGAPLG